MPKLIRACFTALAFLSLSRTAAAQQKTPLAFFGTVVDSAGQPIENADVSIPGLSVAKTTNDKGIFRLEGIPAGSHKISVRRIGYGQIDTTIVFSEDRQLEWKITLGRIVALDSILVTAAPDLALAEFEANKARGIGRFLTSAELRAKETASLAMVLSPLSGINVIRGNTGQQWVTGRRAPRTGCATSRERPNPRGARPGMTDQEKARLAQEELEECVRRERIFYVPDEGEKRMGMPIACYSQVYIDRSLQNIGKPTMPFDIIGLNVNQIEAIEWYESAGQTPVRYAAQGANCGVLIIHSRKTRR